MIQQGFVGDVLAVHYSAVSQAVTERGAGRIWQGDRRNGANTLTIAAGHAIDALCFVLGEFQSVSARLATTVTQWHNPETDETMPVDSPDWISVSGELQSGAQVSFLTATVLANPAGTQFEIYGSEGTLVVHPLDGSLNGGPATLAGARGKERLAPLEIPERFTLIPEATPAGAPRNVGQEYARFAAALAAGEPYHPDFEDAVRRHKLTAAIERSAAEGRTVSLNP